MTSDNETSKGTGRVVLMQGDDSTRRGAEMVKSIVFPDVDYVECDLGVENRLKTDDACIEEAAELLREHRSGIKISTASNDPRMKAKGMKSANILLRPLTGVIGMYRQTMAPGNYKRPIAVMRFGSGDFYSETACQKVAREDGLEARDIVQHIIIGYLKPFAHAAAERAKENKLQMVLASKWTISEGETYLPDICEEVFRSLGLTLGEWRGKGDCYREIADMCGAFIPTNVAPAGDDCAMAYDNGGWMIVCGNANGDTFADIADLQHGGNAMGSECICYDGFSYYELPGGTAPGRKDSDFKGRSFFSPMGTLASFAGAIATAVPAQRSYAEAVMAAAAEYMAQTPEAERCTQTMLEWVANEAHVM